MLSNQLASETIQENKDLECELFFDLCKYAYEIWLIQKNLSDPKINMGLMSEKFPLFTRALNNIINEYCLLQISKLHDPEKTGKKINISIERMIAPFPDNSKIKDELNEKKDQLKKFYEVINPARNKIIAHNDQETYLNYITLGRFEEGADKKYFETLQEFINILYQDSKPFGGAEIEKNVHAFLEVLGRSK